MQRVDRSQLRLVASLDKEEPVLAIAAAASLGQMTAPSALDQGSHVTCCARPSGDLDSLGCPA